MNPKLNIKVDKRTELIYVLGLLADYHLIVKENYWYKIKAFNYFKEYKNHVAVKYFQKIISNGFDYDALPKFIFYLNENSFEIENQFSLDFLKRAGRGNEKKGEKILKEFVRVIRLFVIESNFIDFFNSNYIFYKKVLNQAYLYNKYIDINYLENFYGFKNNSYNIILCPLEFQNGFAFKLQDQNKSNLFAILGIIKINGDIPYFISTENIPLSLDFVIHEFSHSFVNPITDLFINELNKYTNFKKKIQTKNMHVGYFNMPITIINEYLVRASSGVLVRGILGEKNWSYAKFVEIHFKYFDFIYIEEFFKLIEIYFKKRSNYKDFKDFYPEILKLINNLNSNLNGNKQRK